MHRPLKAHALRVSGSPESTRSCSALPWRGQIVLRPRLLVSESTRIDAGRRRSVVGRKGNQARVPDFPLAFRWKWVIFFERFLEAVDFCGVKPSSFSSLSCRPHPTFRLPCTLAEEYCPAFAVVFPPDKFPVPACCLPGRADDASLQRVWWVRLWFFRHRRLRASCARQAATTSRRRRRNTFYLYGIPYPFLLFFSIIAINTFLNLIINDAYWLNTKKQIE